MISLIKGLDRKHMYELMTKKKKKNPSFSLRSRLLTSKSNSFNRSFTSNYMTIVIEIHMFLIPKKNVSGTAPVFPPVQCSLLADT